MSEKKSKPLADLIADVEKRKPDINKNAKIRKIPNEGNSISGKDHEKPVNPPKEYERSYTLMYCFCVRSHMYP